MKRLASIALVVITLMVISSFKTENPDPKSLATVMKVEGKYVFIFCEPVQPYTVVENIKAGIGLGGGLGGGQELSADFESLIQRADKAVKKGKMQPYDALITMDPINGATAIKFN